MRTSNIITGNSYDNYPLLNYTGANAGYDMQILKNLKERFEDSLCRTSKCLLVNLVIKYPENMHAYNDNKCFQYFIEEYRRSLGSKLLHYVWVREQHHSHNQHYHLALFLDGNEMRYFKYPSKAIHLWEKAIAREHNIAINGRGLIHNCKAGIDSIEMNHGITIHRNNRAIQNEAFKLCSYLAKINTKGNLPKNIRKQGASILNKYI